MTIMIPAQTRAENYVLALESKRNSFKGEQKENEKKIYATKKSMDETLKRKQFYRKGKVYWTFASNRNTIFQKKKKRLLELERKKDEYLLEYRDIKGDLYQARKKYELLKGVDKIAKSVEIVEVPQSERLYTMNWIRYLYVLLASFFFEDKIGELEYKQKQAA